MSNGTQNAGCILSEFTVDDLGASFKVVLINSVTCYEREEGREFFIPDYQGLIKKVAVTRAAHPAKLMGADIKFLRKSLGLRSRDLASKLDISPEHFSRCESGDKVLSPNSEKVLRSLVICEAVYVAQKAIQDCGIEMAAALDTISKLLDKLKEIMEGLTIKAVRSAEEELVFYFRREEKLRPAANDRGDLPQVEWLDEAA